MIRLRLMAVLAAALSFAAAGLTLRPFDAAASPRVYHVDSAGSSFVIHVGKAGILKVAGHEHEVIATRFSGEVVADPDNPALNSVTLTFPAADLQVDAAKEPQGDAPKVQAAMTGPGCLDVQRYPEVTFRSTRVQVTGNWDGDTGGAALRVTGDLVLHGVTRQVTFPVRAWRKGDTLTAKGAAVIRQRDFGIEPISAGGGTVKVRNELSLIFRIVAKQ